MVKRIIAIVVLVLFFLLIGYISFTVKRLPSFSEFGGAL